MTIHGAYGTINVKGGDTMNMQEASRLIIALRNAGWTDTAINDLILWMETGDEKYKPAPKAD